MRLEAGKHTGEAPTPVPCSTPTVSNFPAEASLGDKGQVRRPKEPEERKAGSQSTWPSLASTLGGGEKKEAEENRFKRYPDFLDPS